MHQETFHRCLEECDVASARAIWAHVSPHLPQPKTDAEALAIIHLARTQMDTMRFGLRAYSHSWLMDRGLPTGLPDELKPKAERMYPRIVEGVGLAVKTPPHRRELGIAIQEAMKDAVMDIYASNKSPDPLVVRKRVQEVRFKVRKG